MLRIFYGPDTFSRSEALSELRQSLDGDGMLSANTSQFDGRSLKPEELIAACDTVPFLAAKRLVVVDGLLSAQESTRRTGRGARGKVKAVGGGSASPWTGFAEYLQHLPETTELVIVDAAVGQGNTLFEALRPLGEVRLFGPMDRERLHEWVSVRVRERRGSIQPRAAAALAETVGSNLWRMSSEIEKLTLFAHDRPIEVADVRNMVNVSPTGTVFQLVDAVMAGQGAEALRLVRLLLDGDSPGPLLLTMIARQFRQLMLAQDLLRRHTPRPEIASKLEIRSDWALGKLLDQARRISGARLEAGYARLLEADLNIKRGIQDEETSLELLVADLAGLR